MKFETLEFQDKAVEGVLKAVGIYLNEQVEKVGETEGVLKPLIGKNKPYLHRIKAITGAGKTPILASLAGKLENALILWTTPQSAVIEQTTAVLDGKYKHLIGESATILPLSSVVYEDQTWQYEVLKRTMGITVLTTTVAFFNQENRDNLRFRKGHYDQQLRDERKRPLWVFYDEGHNLGENQLSRLIELAPTGIILASASPLSVDLQDLLPGYGSKADREAAIKKRTYEIPTRKVVENHLLKRRIEIHDLNTAEEEILKAAYRKREHLQQGADLPIIACYMMNSADKGRDALETVWRKLIAFGANPKEIAVHLSGAKETAKILAEAQGKSLDEVFPHLQCTYEDGLTPDELRKRGFKHLIWNKAMQEGWDEPNAYVGYFHGLQVDEIQVTQRIGRLVRNPYKDEQGIPCPAPSQELSTTYLYLNVQDSILASVVKHIQEEMLGSPDDLDIIHEEDEDFDQDKSYPKETKVINLLKIECQDGIEKALTAALFKTGFGPEDKEAAGVERTGTIKIGEKGEIKFDQIELATNVPITVEKAVKLALRRRDKRLLSKVSSGSDSTGPWIGESTWQDPRFQEKIPLGCAQHTELEARCVQFIHNALPEEITTDKILAVEIVDGIGYAALQNRKTQDVYAHVIFLETSQDHEGAGPFARECPESILNLLTPTSSETANEWRKSCREAAEWKKAFDSLWNQLQPGDTIEHFCEFGDKHALTITDAEAWEFEEENQSIAPKCDFLSAFTKGKFKAFRNGKEISLNSKN